MPGAPQEQGWAPPPADLLAVRLNKQLHGAVDQDRQVVVHVIKHEELALTAVAGAWSGQLPFGLIDTLFRYVCLVCDICKTRVSVVSAANS